MALTYTFQMPGNTALRPVTVFNSAGVQQATGTLDSDAVFTAELEVGDYFARATSGRTTYEQAGTVDRGDEDGNIGGGGGYAPPEGGIPKADLAAAAQASLGKADTALQAATSKNFLAPAIMNQVTNCTWGGSSIPTATRSAPEQLFGKSTANGRMPHGVFGAMIAAVNTWGAGGYESVDALGRAAVIDALNTTTLLYLDALTNDLNNLGGQSGVPTADKLTRFKNAWRGILARYFSNLTTASDNAAFTYTGTWTTENSPSLLSATQVNVGTGFYPREKRRVTATQNDQLTYVVPAGRTWLWVLLSGVDNTAAGYSGATYSISGAGLAAPITGTTNNIVNRSYHFKADVITTAVKVTGLTPGGTLTIAKTDTNGTKLGFEGVSLPLSSNTPVISPGPFIIVKCYPGGGQLVAAQTAINTALDEVLAEFAPWPTDTIKVIDPTALGFNSDGTMMADGLHPNAKGHHFMRNAIWDVLAGITHLAGSPIR